VKKREITLNPPLAIPALLFASGIIAGNFITSYFIFSILIIIFYLFFYYKKKINFKNSFFFFVFIFGFISIIQHLPLSYEEKPISRYFGEKDLQIFGKVDSKPETTDIRTKFVLKISKIKRKQDDKAKNVTGRIRLYSYQRTQKLQYGDLISYKGLIKKPRNFSNPGGFDYVKYLSFNDIAGVSYTNGKKIKSFNLERDQSLVTKFIREVNQLREDFSVFIKKTTDNDKVFSILCALTTGVKDYIPHKLRNDFSKSGASHILAISGLHLSIVTIIFFSIFNSFFSLVKPLLMRGLSGKFAAMATLVPLLSYAVLSGFSPSTRRAFIMITIYMLSFVIEREKDVLNSLAAAGILILIINPAALFAISFQLSFSAVFFIILGIYATRDITFFQSKNFISRFSMFILVSFSAGLGTIPLVMHYFNVVSFVQLLTNIVIIPVVGFIVVPLGLTALFIFPFSKVIAALFIKLAIPFLSFSISFTEYLSSLSFTWTRCVTPHVFEIICYYALVSGIFLIVLKKSKKGLSVITVSIFLLALHTGFMLKQRFFNKDLKIIVLDVGQGNSALIEGPKGTRILVDGGGFSYNSKFDTGRHIVAPFLWEKKIATLDAVILTHPERDHMNGLVYIMENFSVKKFIKNSDTRKKRSYIDLIEICSKRNVPIIEFPSGQSLSSPLDGKEKITPTGKPQMKFGKLILSFLHPLSDNKFIDKFEKNDYNNNSLVFKVKYKNFITLFPGDIMKRTEEGLALMLRDKLKADILIAPHHGSSTSSSSFFLDKVEPESIIISCGWNNQYNFPDNKVIARYDAKDISYYRTDQHGAVEIVSNGEYFNIVTFKGD
jgi:competence protein ComEC